MMTGQETPEPHEFIGSTNPEDEAPCVRCYVCRRRVPKELTWLARHRVSSGAVRTPDPVTYRMVRKCNPDCSRTEDR